MLRRRLATAIVLAIAVSGMASVVVAVGPPTSPPVPAGPGAVPAADVTKRASRAASLPLRVVLVTHLSGASAADAALPVVPPPPVSSTSLAMAGPRGEGACADSAHSFTGGTWPSTYRWLFRAASTPAGITRKGAAGALKRGVSNITNARNDCGRADNVSATSEYLGTTNRKPALSASGGCGQMDGFNVVGFGSLPGGIAGLTCIWVSGGRILEADIRLASGARWATSLATCSGESMLEAVATHEFGHVYGLGHVSESRHGRLTMSTRLDGLCQNQESKLGLGDLLGLEKRY